MTARRLSRTTAQQVAHWARIGAAVENAHDEAITAVLSGGMPYDEAASPVQAAVRVRWAEQIDERLAQLDLEDAFRSEGRRSWVGADADGRVFREEVGEDGVPIRSWLPDAGEAS